MPKTATFFYVCGACRAMSRSRDDFCQRCGVEEPWENEPEGAQRREKTRPIKLVSVQAQAIARTPVGALDPAFGGGYPEGASCMISGLPGAGKSTIALQVAEAFDARGTLYISEEMPLELLRSYRDRVAPTIENMTAWHAPDFQDVLEYLAEKRPALVVLDSLQRVGEEESASLKELLRVCGQMQSAILVLCHATKAGDFAGLLASQHDVDISLWVRRDEEGAFVQTVKNRHGPAPLETKL